MAASKNPYVVLYLTGAVIAMITLVFCWLLYNYLRDAEITLNQLVADLLLIVYNVLFTLQSQQTIFYENYFVLFGWFGLVFHQKEKCMKNLFILSALPLCYNYAKILVLEVANKPGISLLDFYSLSGWSGLLTDSWVRLAAIIHLAIADLAVGYFLQSQFYYRYNIADVWYGKVIIAVILFFTWCSAPLGILIYFFCYTFIFPGYERQLKKHKKNRWLHPNSRPVHFGQTLPRLLRNIFYIFKAIAGAFVLILHLFAYVLLLIGCVFYYFIYPTVRPPYPHPAAANKKYWLRETPPSFLIPAFVRNATGQMRADLISFHLSDRGIMWSLAHHLLTFAAMVEIGVNQNTNGGLAAALYKQFGPVFPWADGIGVGDKETMTKVMQDRLEHKGPNSVAGPVCDSQKEFSHISTITLSNVQPYGPLMFNARDVIITWIKNFAHRTANETKDTAEWQSLTMSFPRIFNHKLPKPNDIYLVFGQTLFFMINEGRFTEKENAAFLDLSNNLLPFFPSWFNFMVLGGYLERKANKSYYIMMRAMYRQKGRAYKMALAKARELNTVKYDTDRADNEALRLISSIVAIAGAPAPTKLTYAILERLNSDTQALETYKGYVRDGDERKKTNFIKECARLDPAVFWVNMLAHNELPLNLGGQRVPPGTPVHCYVPFGSLDPDVFHDPKKFDPERTNLDQILTWNGLEKWVAAHDGNNAPRYCPGHDISIEVIKLIIEHYLDHLGKNGSESRAKYVMQHFDAFTKSIIQISNARVEHWPRKTFADMVIKNDNVINSYYHPFTLPVNDEDHPDHRTHLYDLAGQFATYAPVTDNNFQFTDEDLISFRRKYLPAFPRTYGKMESEDFYHSDEVVSRLAFFGLGCHRTHKLTSHTPVNDRAREAENIPAEAVYINDTTVLFAYPVRESFERYGAAAYFDNRFKLIGVYVCYKQQLYRPPSVDADAEEIRLWRGAKWVWKTSMFTLVTLQDHLCMSHLIESTAMAKHYRDLRSDGILRVFLKPFTFSTVYINKLAGETLYGTNGLAARVWAFEDITRVLEDLKHSYRYSEHFVPSDMDGLDDSDYPIMSDYKAFRENVKRYVEQLAVILQQSDRGKQEMKQFTKGVCEDLGLLQPKNPRNLNVPSPTPSPPSPPSPSSSSPSSPAGAAAPSECPYSRTSASSGEVQAADIGEDVEEGEEEDPTAQQPQQTSTASSRPLIETPSEPVLHAPTPPAEAQTQSTRRFKDPNNVATFINITTHLILNGSAIHEFVGDIAEYQVSPSYVGCRIVDCYFKDSAQAYALNTALTTSTGIQQPKILDGFKFFFKEITDQNAKKQLVKAYKVFQKDMSELSKRIEEKNNRTRKYPFWFMNPSSTGSSVSK